MSKIGTAHIEIKPVLNPEALAEIMQQIEDAVAEGVARGMAKGRRTIVVNQVFNSHVPEKAAPPTPEALRRAAAEMGA